VASSLTQKASYVAPRPFDRRNVILITIDSARADHFQTYGYARPTSPFLTDLARDGTLRKVETALSTCSESVCGIKSTLTSQSYDRFSGADMSLQDLLRAVGYKTYFVLSGLHDWYGLKQFYGTQSELFFDGTQTERYAGGDDRLLFEGLEKVPIYDGRAAFFSFHLMSAHDAGVRQDAFRVYEPITHEFWRRLLRWQEPESFINGYDNGLTQADAIVRELFDVLKEKGYLDRSLVVILSDHGEALGERGPSPHFGHIEALYQEYVHIPLFIHDDPTVEYRNLKFATQLDVAPTIVERLGLPVPPSWQGRSLLRPEPAARYTFHQTTNAQPVRMVVFRTPDATYKYMRSQGTEELYEIVSDPQEQTNLVTAARADLLEDLRTRLSEYERNGS
jgi:glucan phosphoethanolaminetransferase (alkaline phosphatase superfamily)